MNDNMCYLGYKPCGCLIAAIIDKPEYKRDCAREVASWIRDGLRVERGPSSIVRDKMVSCKCQPPQIDLVLS